MLLVPLFLVQLLGISQFFQGFFPQKAVLKGYGELSQPELGEKPVFNKMVFMVVDALRSDFLFSNESNFKFVHELYNAGSAMGFTAYSNPPTVTLPRLKGITTGSTPNFLDAILNVAEDDTSSTLGEADSWVKQFHRHGKKINFFGDDTWLKLFPGLFNEIDGTNSFFVSDFTEVDFNVTRHLDHQLTNKDWDVLVLHYLGLDHIGHKGGARSSFMKPKQHEMDEVVRRIYQSLDDDTLFVLLGDHGMNDLGNHGGSSSGETSAAMLFISDKFKSISTDVTLPLPYNEYSYLDRIQQIDLVPTLSLLFGLPIPKNSLGVVIEQILPLFSSPLAVLSENLAQFTKLAGDSVSFSDKDSILFYLRDTQGELTKSATDYNSQLIFIGIGCLVLVTLASTQYLSIDWDSFIFLLVTILVGASFFGSSFVEEEHQIWWWMLTGINAGVWIATKSNTFVHIVLFVCVRLLRGWNNMGQKTVYDNVIKTVLSENVGLAWLLIGATCSLGTWGVRNGGLGGINHYLAFMVAFTAGGLCFSYKAAWSFVNAEKVPEWVRQVVFKCASTMGTKVDAMLVPLARLFFQFIGAIYVIRLSYRLFGGKTWYFSDLQYITTLVLILQTSTYNIPLLLICHIVKNCVGYLLTKNCRTEKQFATWTSIVTIVLSNFTFFAMGNTNSLATVDLSNAYNGVSSNYNMHVVALLTALSNMAGPIFWSLSSLVFLFENGKFKPGVSRHFGQMLAYTSCIGTILMISCYVLRYHLFIWSVFSPKFCYFLAWNLMLVFHIGIGGILSFKY